MTLESRSALKALILFFLHHDVFSPQSLYLPNNIIIVDISIGIGIPIVIGIGIGHYYCYCEDCVIATVFVIFFFHFWFLELPGTSKTFIRE